MGYLRMNDSSGATIRMVRQVNVKTRIDVNTALEDLQKKVVELQKTLSGHAEGVPLEEKRVREALADKLQVETTSRRENIEALKGRISTLEQLVNSTEEANATAKEANESSLNSTIEAMNTLVQTMQSRLNSMEETVLQNTTTAA